MSNELGFRIKSGDETALSELYALHRSWVFGKARYMLRCPRDADEAVNDVFMAVWRYRARWEAEPIQRTRTFARIVGFRKRVAGDIDTAIRHEWWNENVRLGQFDPDILDAGDDQIYGLLADTLIQEGAPFEAHTKKDVIGYFRRLKDGKAILRRPAFNIVHSALHGFAMSVFGDMSDRKHVRIRGIYIEPE